MTVATEHVDESLYVSTGCHCGWKSVSKFMSIAILLHFQHQADCAHQGQQAA